MGDWVKVQLDDVADLSGGYAFKSSQYTDAGRFVLRTVNIDDQFSITMENANFISEAEAKEFERFALQEHDTLFVMVAATLGKIGYVRARDLPALLNQNMWVIRAKDGAIDPVFLHYLFRQISKIPLSWVGGSARSFLRRDDVRKLEFELPGSSEQERIAHTLKTLDDKIELNRRMNETLEEMARALFRDWFVDFGPTRRQMEGATDPAAIMGHAFPPEKATTFAPLFPARLGDDGLPEGWVEQPFEAFVEIIGGGTPKTKIAEYWGGDIPWFSVVDAPTQGAVYVHSTEKSITTAGLEKSSARMVPEGTTIISARGTVGKIGMAPGDMTFNQSCYALRPKKPVGERFVFLATGQLVERLQAMAHGSVFSTITRNTFSSLSFAGAEEPCYSAFEEITAPLFAKIKTNGQQNQTLAEMRDLLLPKLMSGEIRLKDAEAAL